MKDFVQQILIRLIPAAVLSGGTLLLEWIVSILNPNLSLIRIFVPQELLSLQYFYGIPLLIFLTVLVLLFQKIVGVLRRQYFDSVSLNLGVATEPETHVGLFEQGILFQVGIHTALTSTRVSGVIPQCSHCGCGLLKSKRLFLPGFRFTCPACNQKFQTAEPWSQTVRRVELRAAHNYKRGIKME